MPSLDACCYRRFAQTMVLPEPYTYRITRLSIYRATELHAYSHSHLLFLTVGEDGTALNCPRCRLSSLSSFASAVLPSASASMPASTFGCRPYSKLIDRKTGLPLLTPPWLPAHFLNLGNIKSAAEYIRPIDVAKKKEGRNAPPSGQPASRLPACQFTLPETLGALWGRALRMENSIAAMPAMRVTHTTPNVRFTSRG